MPDSGTSPQKVTLERMLPRVHARALGCAVGVTAGVAVFLLTAFHVLFLEERGLPIGILSLYFRFYDVTWPGAFIGLVWGFVTGFAGGWLLAFIHNVIVGAWLAIVRMRSDLSLKRNILDQLR